MTRKELQRWLKLLDRDPQTSGMTTRQLELVLYLSQPGYQTTGRKVSHIALDMGWEKPVVTRAATNLYERGLAMRKPDPVDLRGCYVMTTREGVALASQLIQRTIT